MEQRPPKLLEIFMALASTAAAVYLTLPPQERMWLKLEVFQRAQRMAARLAWTTGHRGMGDELAGRDFQRYGIAYRLSQARDYLARKLQEMRP